MSINKRGQAALEFLMTYGWAILVVLVVIGALAYFGVLNPSILLPEKCTLTTGLSCKDHRIDSSTGNVSLSLENGMGSGMYITKITLNGKGTTYFNGDAGCNITLDGSHKAEGYYTGVGTVGAEYFGFNCGNMTSGGDCRYSNKEAWHIANGESGTVKIPCVNAPLQPSLITAFAGKTKVDFSITYYSDDSSAEFSHTMQGELLARNEG